MRGGFFAAAALWLLGIGCGGATTKSPDGDSAPTEPSDGAAAPDRCDCVTSTVRWWRAGGLVPLAREASIEPCAAFGYRESGPELKQCRSTVQGCGDALGIDDVSAALAHPDVQAALEQAPIVYGRDLRPIDGQVDHIEVDGKVIEIGDECTGEEPHCSLPLGIDRLGRLLGNLQFQELASATCKVN